MGNPLGWPWSLFDVTDHQPHLGRRRSVSRNTGYAVKGCYGRNVGPRAPALARSVSFAGGTHRMALMAPDDGLSVLAIR